MSAIYALVVLLFNVLLVLASSAPRKPLTQVTHPTTHALEILPRHNTLKKRLSTDPFLLDSPTLYHSDSFRLTLSAFNETFHLHLRPNDHFIHPAARINYYKNGVLDRTVPLLRESVRAYWGEVVSAERTQQRMREDAAGVFPRPELGWARILVLSQGDAERGIPPTFEGAFSVGGVTHNIQTRSNYLRKRLVLDPDLLESNSLDSQLVIWRDSDVVQDDRELHRGCMHGDPWASPSIRSPWEDAWSNPSLARRDDAQGNGSSNNFESNIGQTTGCSSTQKIIYMGVAADCGYVSAHGSTQNATSQILNNWNTASSLYKQTFNLSLGIIELNIQDPECPTQAPTDAPWNVPCNSTNVTLNDRLSLFSEWRGTKGNDGAGLWHLMSGCPTGSEVGVAWLGTLCQQTTTGSAGSFVSGVAVSTNGLTEWEVVSHEIGHNFGAIHDCQSDCDTSSSPICCPLSSSTCNANDQFIMSPVTSSSQKTFSQCSLGNICSLMQANVADAVNATCLQDSSSSVKTITLNMCGNGIVEEGEQCDPGQNVTSACCDSATCQFVSGAVCDPTSSVCCTSSCSFAPSSQVCRPAADPSCDIQETCTGTSADCPADQFEPNGQSCGSSGLTCTNGVCTSLDQQCQVVGASMNLTTACSTTSTSCQVSCQDPTDTSQCIQLQAQLIDGSSCGLAGTCQSGQCLEGSVLDTAKAWYVQNLQISIPVTVVAAVLTALLIWALVLFCKRKCLKRKASSSWEPALSGKRGARLGSWQGPPAAAAAAGGAGTSGFGTLPPIVPFATRPAPAQAALMAQTSGSSGNHNRSASIPASLRSGGGDNDSGMRNVAPSGPASQRNQSWDSAYGVPPRRGSRRLSRDALGDAGPRSSGGNGSRPGSSSSTRAREPVFPRMTATGVQGRTRTSTTGAPAHWVDPTKWNGPMR